MKYTRRRKGLGDSVDENKVLEMKKSLTEKELEALNHAVSVIWLNDNSDYLNGLWDIIRTIIGDDLFNDEDFSNDVLYKVLRPIGD